MMAVMAGITMRIIVWSTHGHTYLHRLMIMVHHPVLTATNQTYKSDIMKIHFIVILLITSLCTATGQPRVNKLTPQEFENISINGKTLKTIWATNSDEVAVQHLFGPASEVIIHNDFPSLASWTLLYPGFELSFSQGTPSNGNLSSFEITNSSVMLRVKGTVIRIGDNISKLGAVKINDMTTGGKSILHVPEGADDPILSIRFDPSTKKITEIIYYVLT